MKTMHLFAGAGGGLLCDLILGHTPIVAIEWDAYCCDVLRQRAAEGWFPGLHVWEGDIRLFDPSEWAGRVDCLSAGFPCQDISAAGSGAGLEGERSGLVREVFRAVKVIRPSFVFLENSPRIETRGRNVIIGELVAQGYSWRDGTLAAAEVGAGHERNRWWLLAADANGLRKLESQRGVTNQRRWPSHSSAQIADTACVEWRENAATGNEHDRHDTGRKETDGRIGSSVEDAADSYGKRWDGRTWNEPGKIGGHESEDSAQSPTDALRDRLQRAIQLGGLSETEAEAIQAVAGYCGTYHWAPPDIGVCRVVDGIPARMDRIRALGNAQVPIQAAAAWKLLGGP